MNTKHDQSHAAVVSRRCRTLAGEIRMHAQVPDFGGGTLVAMTVNQNNSLNDIMHDIVYSFWNRRAEWLPDFCVWLLSAPVGCSRLWNDQTYRDHLEKIVVAFDLHSDACEFFHVANPLRALRDTMQFADEVERNLVDAAVFVAVAGVQLAKTDMPCDANNVAGLLGAAVDCLAIARFGTLTDDRVNVFKKAIVAKMDELYVDDHDRQTTRMARALAVIAGGGCPAEQAVA